MAFQKQKLTVIFYPMLIASIGLLLIYSGINWFIFQKLNLFTINEETIELWAPMVISALIVLIWIRPRINLLQFVGGNGNLPFLYQLIAGLAICVPTLVAQNYISTAYGELVQVEKPSELMKEDNGKYFHFNKLFVDKYYASVSPSFEVAGRYNEDFNMSLHFILPILDEAKDTANHKCIAWLGLEYSKQISNKLEDAQKEVEYNKFFNETIASLESKAIPSYTYYKKLGPNSDLEHYQVAIKQNEAMKAEKNFVLIGQSEAFEARTGNTLYWVLGSFGIAMLVFFLMLLRYDLPEGLEQKNNQHFIKSNTQEWKEFITFLKPRDAYFITPIIINLNLIIFAIMVFSGLGFIGFNGEDLLKWGANYGPLTKQGEWWRLLSSTFLHGGILHVLANMYGFFFVGVILEPILGKVRFLLAYLACGILASCASIGWYDATVSVGASGAIFGMYGVFLSLLLTKVFEADFSKAFLSSTLVFVGFNLLMGITGGIDNAAHIGGLISGMGIGFLLRLLMEKKEGNMGK